jgi:predicted amidohydrolase
METVTLALWAANLGRPLAGLDEWLGIVETRIGEAERAGADLLVLPEWIASHWLSFAPKDLPADREVAWMAQHAQAALDGLSRRLAGRRPTLLAGTMPVAEDGGFVNRAHLLTPDGCSVHQDKLCLTPFETDPAAWLLQPGRSLTVIAWRALRLAVNVCLDIQQPALAARLQGLDLDLVLVPSMTDFESGYRRVFGCARARAVELMAPVAAVGTIGTQHIKGRREPNTSAAAVYLPCEVELGSTGVHAEIPMLTEANDDGPMLVARDVPVGHCRRLRRVGAEAWPGPWDAAAVTLRHVRLDGAGHDH